MAEPIEFSPAPVKMDVEFFEKLFYPRGWREASYYEASQAGNAVADALFAAWNCNEELCKVVFDTLAQRVSENGDMITCLENMLKSAREMAEEK